MTPWQGIFDPLLTPAEEEAAAERPPFLEARYTAILAARRRRFTTPSACRQPGMDQHPRSGRRGMVHAFQQNEPTSRIYEC
jgi:hypothetical protein